MAICHVKGCSKSGRVAVKNPLGEFGFCNEHVDAGREALDSAMRSLGETWDDFIKRLREQKGGATW